MIKMLELREMIKLVNKSSIQEFNLKNGGVRISMKKPLPKIIDQQMVETPQEMLQTALNEAAATLEESIPAEPAVKEKVKEHQLHTIVSTFIGVFSSSIKPGAEPYVKVGDKITSNSIVGMCNMEALKLSHEILSDVDGEIVEVLVEEGQLVDYGQPLFIVMPE
ncbi:biotin/lipoyl-containing protein [Bacillus sp. EB600]|uniref:acetyl-CoA carboxylase biotin carboxyl carrier protein n=1 Tax=Bacillus sp. EB600 TaxID=2806345 RepID=UPI00210EF027|nr:biotin/lipoyl-containing protein [Bacillus sp. EB600]MCQ6280893.1 biotin/lipoyl-binding protein [Bacillus sp. EB600]